MGSYGYGSKGAGGGTGPHELSGSVHTDVQEAILGDRFGVHYDAALGLWVPRNTVLADVSDMPATYPADPHNHNGYHEEVVNRGAASGYAPLGADGNIPSSHLPPLYITEPFVVETEAEQLALVAQLGDVAIRTDIERNFIQNGGAAGTMADWTELAQAVVPVQSVDGRIGTVDLSDLYSPASHAGRLDNPHGVTAVQAGALTPADKTALEDFANEARNVILSGGGTISWSVVADTFKWNQRFLILPVSDDVVPTRYISLPMPTSGVTDATGAERASTDGIILSQKWEGLWLVHTRGSGAEAGNSWKVISYTDAATGAYFDDENAYLIAVRNGDNESLYIRNGLVLRPGKTIEAGQGATFPTWNEVAAKPTTFLPAAHKTSHATAEADAIAPEDIGAGFVRRAYVAGSVSVTDIVVTSNGWQTTPLPVVIDVPVLGQPPAGYIWKIDIVGGIRLFPPPEVTIGTTVFLSVSTTGSATASVDGGGFLPKPQSALPLALYQAAPPTLTAAFQVTFYMWIGTQHGTYRCSQGPLPACIAHLEKL